MRSAICLVPLVVLLLIGAPSVGAQEATQSADAALEPAYCVDPPFLTTALLDCAGGFLLPPDTTAELDASSETASELGGLDARVTALETSEGFVIPSYCRLKVDAVFWGGTQWFELAQSLAADRSECAEYYVSIPPQDIRTRLRGAARFTEVRDLNPRIHPVAEIRWVTPPPQVDSGWRGWVVGPTHPDPTGWQPGRTFYGAGVEARRRMVRAGVDVERGETWAFNELTEDILFDRPGARAEVLEFLRGLYEGGPDLPDVRGIVFNVAPPSTLSDASAYKEHLKAWLEDGSFWRELDTYADFFAQEVYPSALNWGVADVPRATRAEYLNDYLQHMTMLAENGPDAVDAARRFLRRTYLPLGNAAWPHPNIGNTNLLTADQMRQFVSTQVYAMRHFANAHPQTAPQGRIGFGWAPLVADSSSIRERLAVAIEESSEQGTNSQMDACGPPGEHIWCGVMQVQNASLNDAWKMFASWD